MSLETCLLHTKEEIGTSYEEPFPSHLFAREFLVVCFKSLKSAFFDQNMNRLELEGHGRDELRNNFEKWLMLYIIHTIFTFLGYCALAREKMIILRFKK